ncbi:Exocyst complex component sec10 [Neolecta irregularis DAH-3]|uniref:Exocyst complex component sec10 n=1 Tax=Neolecta irregularis (strain DAH-3) TaxID=1198029 RepID=A0A1U7LVE7_NEOID|nr:Exocyst complex component sec10 [Neolecta irregularis DAH-3]|eukprot:OLL26522.1 Exocyst complex component sec10 [Neolecta irregularis DAH-3]
MPPITGTIYDLDPKIQKLLTVDYFSVLAVACLILTPKSSSFSVEDFVEALSSTNNNASERSSGAFDPKPYIRTFELAIDKLKGLKTEISRQTEGMRKSTKRTEQLHNQKIRQIGQNFHDLVSSFEGLERRINEVGNTAIRIGEQLEQVDKQQQRASEGEFLVASYLDFRQGDSSKLEALRREKSHEAKARCAMFTRRLLAICKDVNLEGAEATREHVEKFSEVVEKDLLKQFDKAYRHGDFTGMSNYAKILHDFNGGSSVIQVFVNQHDFFIAREKLNIQEIGNQDDIWQILPDPDAKPPGIESGLKALFAEVRATVETEMKIIQDVFPEPAIVMQVFLQRVFAQPIQLRLESVLKHAEKISNLAYLRTLQSTHLALVSLVDDLKMFDMTHVLRVGDLATSNIVQVLDQNLEDLFVPYLEGNRYRDRERKSIQELYVSFLFKFSAYHTQRKANKGTTMFDRFVHQWQSPVQSATKDRASDNPEGRINYLFRIAGIDRANSLKDKKDHHRESIQPELIITAEDGQLSVESATRMLRWHAEAIGRAVELVSTSDAQSAKNMSFLLDVLLENIGEEYVDVALDSAYDTASTLDTKLEPDFGYFVNVGNALTIMHLVYSYCQIALLPLAGPSLTLRREMVMSIQKSMTRFEGKVNLIMQKTIESALNWLSILLSRQKRNDFKPKDDDEALINLQTMPCQTVVAFLGKIHSMANQTLEEETWENFLTEMGIGFHSLLLEHFKKFTVNYAGAIILTKDITFYEEAIALWKLPALDERMVFLRELGNVFVVRPEILHTLLLEGVLTRVKPSFLLPYLSCRVDYYAQDIERMIIEIISENDRASSPQSSFRRDALGWNKLKDLGERKMEGLKLEGLKLMSAPLTLKANSH